MKLDMTNRFYLEILLCMATSDVKFTEHNNLTLSARRLVSYEFPNDIGALNISDICYLIEGFFFSKNISGKKAATNFVKAFARKDTDTFQVLAEDQSKPIHFRKYKMRRGCDKLVISVAALYGIDYSQKTELIK